MLEEDIREITKIPEKEMIFGKKKKKKRERFDNETKCYICNKEFDDDVKVRDHCHFTGRYRGAAHNSCNLNYRNLILRLWCLITLVGMIVIYS